MAPSAALQARIAAFENISFSSSLTGGSRTAPSPPQRQRQFPSKNTQDPHILDADPMSPTADSLETISPLKPSSLNPPRSSSPPVLGRKTSLIDLSELSASPKFKESPKSSSETGSSLLPNSLQKPQLPPRLSSGIPPLPPRKPSQSSLKNSPPSKVETLGLPIRSSPISIASSKLLGHSDSLLSLRDPLRHASNSSNASSRHQPASSISSFQSVSLSSTGTGTTEHSLDGSYEAVTSTVATSLVSTETPSSPVDVLDSPKPKASLEKLTLNNTVFSQPSVTRRPAPPPPLKPRKLSQEPSPSPANHSISSSISRPVPIPMNAKKRYDTVFDRHVSLAQKDRSTSGWRGSSLDLLTGVDIDDFNDRQRSLRMDGYLVKSIWICSKLSKLRLRKIWAECDPKRTGSLDREKFALGMWRIDEALRGAQQSRELSSLKNPSLTHPSRDAIPTPTYPSRVPHSK